MREVFSMEDIFNVMIELETLGNKHYTQMVKMTDDHELKSLFELLAVQEIAHKDLYTQYKNKDINYERNLVTDDYSRYMDSLITGTFRFLKDSKHVRDLNHGLSIAVNLEKDTILFLTELRRIIDEEYYEAIDNITNQEREHLRALYNYKGTIER